MSTMGQYKKHEKCKMQQNKVGNICWSSSEFSIIQQHIISYNFMHFSYLCILFYNCIVLGLLILILMNYFFTRYQVS